MGVVVTGAVCTVAYLAGLALSPYILPIDIFSPKPPSSEISSAHYAPTPSSPPVTFPRKESREDSSVHSKYEFTSVAGVDANSDPFHGVDIVVHRNGAPDPCSRQDSSHEHDGTDSNTLSHASQTLLHAANTKDYGDKVGGGMKRLDDYEKYDFDAVLTHALVVGKEGKSILRDQGKGCGPTWKESDHYLDRAPHLKGKTFSPMIKFCDMGIDRTPIQLDHDKLARVPEIRSMPC
ncbi:hypothetical protein ACHAWF_000607, partial [Thalassiosira exigua]